MKNKHEYRALVEYRETRYCTITAGSKQEAIELIENGAIEPPNISDRLSCEYAIIHMDERS